MYESAEEIKDLLCSDRQALFDAANKIKIQHKGRRILLRGIVEFSNICDRSCAYCGISCRNRELERYTMKDEEILSSVKRIASSNIDTVVLQSGETGSLDDDRLAWIIRKIKKTHDNMAVTLSVGEKSRSSYKKWKDSGADRYLLKIETSSPELYRALHPGMSLENRIRCLSDLKELGYETGSGTMVGLPGQTLLNIAKDILFFYRSGFEMIGTGPFIPHKKTALKNEPAGDIDLVLRTLAATRIVMKDINIPATTAVGSLSAKDHRFEALECGANVLMPNFTPSPYMELYEIYPHKMG